jgi:hypothetical protein
MRWLASKEAPFYIKVLVSLNHCCDERVTGSGCATPDSKAVEARLGAKCTRVRRAWWLRVRAVGVLPSSRRPEVRLWRFLACIYHLINRARFG